MPQEDTHGYLHEVLTQRHARLAARQQEQERDREGSAIAAAGDSALHRQALRRTEATGEGVEGEDNEAQLLAPHTATGACL